jgi:hypothetical protein
MHEKSQKSGIGNNVKVQFLSRELRFQLIKKVASMRLFFICKHIFGGGEKELFVY